MTNLRCIYHPKYDGNGYILQGCYNCANMFTQVLRAKRDLAVAAAATRRRTDEVHMGMQGVQTATSSGQKDV